MKAVARLHQEIKRKNKEGTEAVYRVTTCPLVEIRQRAKQEGRSLWRILRTLHFSSGRIKQTV